MKYLATLLFIVLMSCNPIKEFKIMFYEQDDCFKVFQTDTEYSKWHNECVRIDSTGQTKLICPCD